MPINEARYRGAGVAGEGATEGGVLLRQAPQPRSVHAAAPRRRGGRVGLWRKKKRKKQRRKNRKQ